MIARFLILLIKFYQGAISPWLGPSCRFSPTCSTYTIICITRFGTFKGIAYGIKRILRCNPFGATGYDPPPDYKKMQG